MKFYLACLSRSRTCPELVISGIVLLLYCLSAVSCSLTFRIRVLEETQPGAIVGNLSQFTPNFRSYELGTQTEYSHYFAYNKGTGIIDTTRVIDRDIIPNTPACRNGSELGTLVFISSKHDPQINAKVIVDDVNDNSPKFPSATVMKRISEDSKIGHVVELSTATDTDCGPNGTLHYSITKGNATGSFGLSSDKTSLNLVLMKRFDRETKQFHVLNISACDEGIPPRCGFFMLNVTVDDYNDNKPLFHNVPQSIQVEEKCKSGKFITTLNVSDADSGINAMFSLSIKDVFDSKSVESKQLFQLDTARHELNTATCLTYQRYNPSYTVVIEAKDRGHPTQRSDVVIQIDVVDINDHSPILSHYLLKPIKENLANKTTGIIYAYDHDNGQNANVTVRIISGNPNDKFYLVPTADTVFTLKFHGTLDREVYPQYNITVEGFDHGVPQRSTMHSIIIPVTDVNDNAPVCQVPVGEILISESAPVGSYVTIIHAVDKDEGKNARVKYILANQRHPGLFEIVGSSGLLTTNGLLDHETQASIELNVTVEDYGEPPLSSSCSLRINITDVNDNRPLLTHTIFNVSVPEDIQVGSVVVTLSATDADEGDNSELTFSVLFAPPLVMKTFHLNSTTGTIHTLLPLDREVHNFYTLNLMVKDHGKPPLSSTAVVNINILDVNDNSPVIYPDNYYLNIFGNQTDGFITNITATDIDNGQNGTVHYEIVERDPKNAHFHINHQTGRVTINSSLDSGMLYTLKVVAKDGQGVASNISTLQITVITSHDVLPHFEEDSYSFSVEENVQTGTYIGSVKAKRKSVTGIISYSIYNGDPTHVFSVNSNGQIRTLGNVDSEKQRVYRLQVLAKTEGKRILTGWTTVTITVEDVNDNIPQFQHMSYIITVEDTVPVGSSIYKATAFDPDLGFGGIVKYDLSHDSGEMFDIDAHTGNVTVAKNLSRLMNYTHSIKIMATDSGLPNLTSVLCVTVNIVKVNINPPLFQSNFTVVPLTRDVPVNHPFLSITASDPGGINSQVYFQLSGVGNQMGYFGIFPNGMLFARRSLLHTHQSQFLLEIIAIDKGYPALHSSALVKISVLSASKHQQLFKKNTFKFDVYENEKPGTFVGKLDFLGGEHFVVALAEDYSDFTLDNKSYEIRTRKVLDREKLYNLRGNSHFSLYVQASYKTKLGSRVDIATILIKVRDRNDNKPVFRYPKYTLHMMENEKPGAEVFKLVAVDLDEGENAKVNFSVTNSSVPGPFFVKNDGNIILNRSLENTNLSHFSLTVQVRNIAPPYFHSKCLVEIIVIDANNNRPEFVEPKIFVSVREDFTLGQTFLQVSARDKDIGRNSRLAYIISGGNSESVFKLDRETGKLSLSRELDFENRKEFVLNVTAIDSGVPPLSSSQQVIINVTDVNDNAPHFVKCVSTLSVLENITVGTQIGKCMANDTDIGHNGMISYSISREKPRGNYFSIASSNGTLYVKKPLDRELFQSHQVEITARDQAIPESSQLSHTKTITINLEDINDNFPRFTSPPSVFFDSSVEKGACLITLTACDMDIGANGNVTFKKGPTANSIVNLHSDGRVVFEEKPVRILYNFSVIASDMGSPPKETSQTLIVFAVGGSGMSFIHQKYSSSVIENEPTGTKIITVSVAEKGTEYIRYFITNDTSEGLVVLDSKTGDISTNAPIDREGRQGRIINLVIYAVDINSTSPNTASASVHVTILDENDNEPRFPDENYVKDVSEDTKNGSKILTLHASDDDQGKNGSIFYNIVGGNSEGFFRINKTTGEVYLSHALDRELRSLYVLNVTASDNGRPQLSSWTTVVFNVLDVNDNIPVFTSTNYNFTVIENSPVGTVLGVTVANDKDLRQNGEVLYSLSGDDSYLFSVDVKSGMLTTASVFDREKIPIYLIKVVATDRGTPFTQSSSAFVYISILDENDNDPTFNNNQPHKVDVPENTRIKTPILTLTASDKDFGLNARLAYFISGGNGKKAFSISSDGTISTASPLDRETTAQYNLQVTVSDSALPYSKRRFASTIVYVNVIDVNDEVPYFLSADIVHLREDQKLGKPFTTVVAVDKDTGENGQILYELQGVLANTYFQINRYSGALSLKRTLDREKQISGHVDVTVEAKDRGQPPKLKRRDIKIIIDDVNDNSPMFNPHQEQVMVYENISIGTELTHITAFDIDQGRNGIVEYAIASGNLNRTFAIHPIDGVITVVKPLDREVLNSYRLGVTAFDLGTPRLENLTILQIQVLDVNDNPPRFQVSNVQKHVKENVFSIPNLVTFVANDNDEGRNSEIMYSIANGENTPFLQIGTNTGMVSLLSPLDREIKSSYSVVIRAEDKGNPPLYTQAYLTIIVDDENDNSPVFIRPDLKVSILEGSPANSKVCVMNATDADTGRNGKITYTLVNDFSRFKIKSETGEISTIIKLDRELDGSQFKLDVKAKDGGSPPRETFGYVAVRIADINDNKAKFESKKYTAYISVSAPSGTFVTVVSATDKDEGLNGKVVYAILSSGSSEFYVEPETGNILTKVAMSSFKSQYTLEIQALNAETKHEDDNATLDIFVTTETFPVFDISNKVFNISEDTIPGHLILRAKATDDPVFRIASGNEDEQFTLDIISRNLTLKKKLDHERKTNYSLWLEASLNTFYSTYVNIQVFVVDVNDNKPIFQKTRYDANLIESTFPNVVVVSIIAEDYDSGQFGLVQYSIIESSARVWFRIDKSTGIVYTTRGIDRETNSSFDFTVQAEDQGIPRKTNEVGVHVTIIDANDNPPVFDEIPPAYVLEGTSRGSVVTTVFANDRDKNSRLSYSLAQAGNYNQTFSIRPHNGEIVLNEVPDRETIANYQLTVLVTDGRFTSNASLNVIIQDVDDNLPKFLKHEYLVKISELSPIGSLVVDLNATDFDVGPNADVLYCFERTAVSDKFRINSKGIVTLASTLRYVTSSNGNANPNEYNVTVLAWNPSHPLTKAQTTVIIDVIDANNHPPTFEKHFYFAYIPSLSKKDVRVVTVKATDVYDVGSNSEVKYDIVGGNGTANFKIEPNTGSITVNSDLSSFADKVFLLEVQASDRGEPIQVSKINATVYIMVTVANSYSPVFDKPSYDVSVPENYDVGKTFLRVSASDRDSGVNGEVSYSIHPGKQAEYFSVDSHSGAITIANVKLDYEYKTKYFFDIVAKDGAHQPKNATVTVQVDVDDYNDNPPVFQPSSYNVKILENSPIGSVVTIVSATDRDTVGNTITYMLNADNEDVFTINENTGKITTKGLLDFESKTVYTLAVLAKDSGQPQKTSACDVVVTVIGVNEFTPIFLKKKYLFSTPEDSPIGTTVGQVTATDSDTGYDGVVQYMLVDPSENKNFHINRSSGHIVVISHLDSETTSQVQLTALAMNPGEMIVNADNTDKANIIVVIKDRNDPPRFLQQLVKVSVEENIPIGTLVGNFSAVDDDVNSDFSSPFTYSILLGNLDNSFELLTVGDFAIIKTDKFLDREKTSLFNLTIAATDNTEPSLMGTAKLIVEIRDVNDNAPLLKPGICPAHVKENMPRGTSVLRLDAVDRDIDPNKDPYTFQIVNKEHVPFTIDSLTWELRTDSALDREKVSLYNLDIQVQDSGYPKQSSVSSCTIIVDDVNDNQPSAETRQVTVNVPVTGFKGDVIGDVSPVDVDEINSYTCEVEGNLHRDTFSFQPSSCVLKVKKPRMAFYVLNVRARDELQSVSYSLNISFNKISDVSSQRSVVLRLSGISPEQFLAVMQYLPCGSGYDKQVLSIQEVSSSLTDVLLAHLKNGVYISKQESVGLMNRCKNNMKNILRAKVINIDYNLCSSSNPCINGLCQPGLVLQPENRTTLYSKSHVFVSMYHRSTANCVCDSGYTGNNCEHSTKACLPKPCTNGGTCVPTATSFKCLCQPNYSGARCETFVNLCDPNPCSHTSLCISSPEGPKCQCDFGGRGERCELSSIGFNDLSYMKLPTLSSANGEKFNNISLQFATIQSNALILFNRDDRDTGNSKFIAVEIIESQLHFSFSLGRGIVRIMANNNVSDGKWHNATAVRDKSVGYLNVDGKVFNSVDTKDADASVGNLDLQKSPLYFGGVPSLDIIFSTPGQVQSYDFVGCMRDVYLSGAMLDMNTALEKHGIISRCPRIPEKECPKRCAGGSTCIDKWFTRVCQCKDDGGNNECSQNSKPLTFSSGSVLQFRFDPSFLRANDFQEKQMALKDRQRRNAGNAVQTLAMSVRSRSDDAFLWRAEDTSGNYTQLQMKSGFVSVSFKSGDHEYHDGIVSHNYIDTGLWFNISLTRVVSNNALTLTVGSSSNQTYFKQPYLFFGGTWRFGTLQQSAEFAHTFEGCLSSIKINDEIINLNITNQFGILTLQEGQLGIGCDAPDFCSSNPCPGESSRCINEWKTYKCVGALGTNDDALSVGAIAAIVFFAILVVAIVVAVIAVKKRRRSNEFASRFSRKANVDMEQDNSRESSSSESIRSRKTPSRHSLDSGVDIRNTNTSSSPGGLKKTTSVSTNVIPLGSPDEYTIVTSRRDSGSDQRDTGFTDSECEFGLQNLGANLTISSIPSDIQSIPGRNRKSRFERSTLNYNKKVPYLINQGYLKETRRTSRSTNPSEEPESIEMQNYSIDIEEAEHYSIGDASLATYSDLTYSNNAARSSDIDRMRYRPSLGRFSESEDSVDERQLSHLDDTLGPFEPAESSSVSSDGGFTVSEYDYGRRASFDHDEVPPTSQGSSIQTENSNSSQTQEVSFANVNNESSVDDPGELPKSLNWDNVNWGTTYNNLRDTCSAIAQLRDAEEDSMIV